MNYRAENSSAPIIDQEATITNDRLLAQLSENISLEDEFSSINNILESVQLSEEVKSSHDNIDFEKITYEGAKKVCRFLAELAEKNPELANRLFTESVSISHLSIQREELPVTKEEATKQTFASLRSNFKKNNQDKAATKTEQISNKSEINLNTVYGSQEQVNQEHITPEPLQLAETPDPKKQYDEEISVVLTRQIYEQNISQTPTLSEEVSIESLPMPDLDLEQSESSTKDRHLIDRDDKEGTFKKSQISAKPENREIVLSLDNFTTEDADPIVIAENIFAQKDSFEVQVVEVKDTTISEDKETISSSDKDQSNIVELILEIDTESDDLLDEFNESMQIFLEQALEEPVMDDSSEFRSDNEKTSKLNVETKPPMAIVSEMIDKLSNLEEEERRNLNLVIVDIVNTVRMVKDLSETGHQSEVIDAMQSNLEDLATELFRQLGIEYEQESLAGFIKLFINPLTTQEQSGSTESADLENEGTHEAKNILTQLYSLVSDTDHRTENFIGKLILYMLKIKPKAQLLY